MKFLVCVLTGMLVVASILLALLGESESERSFRAVFGVDAPKTEAGRIRARAIVARRLERTAQRVATFALAREIAMKRPLSQGETEQMREKALNLLQLGSEAAIEEFCRMLVLAVEFQVFDRDDPAQYREARARGDESRPVRGRLALSSLP